MGLLLLGDIHNTVRGALRTRIGRDFFGKSVRSVSIGTVREVPVAVEPGLHRVIVEAGVVALCVDVASLRNQRDPLAGGLPFCIVVQSGSEAAISTGDRTA